jgi:hypothetical protein
MVPGPVARLVPPQKLSHPMPMPIAASFGFEHFFLQVEHFLVNFCNEFLILKMAEAAKAAKLGESDV